MGVRGRGAGLRPHRLREQGDEGRDRTGDRQQRKGVERLGAADQVGTARLRELGHVAAQGAEARSAVLYAKSASVVEPTYVWKRTDDWIVFPWSAEPPVTRSK